MPLRPRFSHQRTPALAVTNVSSFHDATAFGECWAPVLIGSSATSLLGSFVVSVSLSHFSQHQEPLTDFPSLNGTNPAGNEANWKCHKTIGIKLWAAQCRHRAYSNWINRRRRTHKHWERISLMAQSYSETALTAHSRVA